MSRTTYYTLVASLPRLPHFEEAAWLPMSRKQMNRRLTMLTPQDALELRLAEDLLKWQRQPITKTDQEMVEQYRKLLPAITDPSLREIVEYRMAQRTALVALRRRRQGLPAPAVGEAWGVGPWLNLVTSAWDRDDLGLGHLLPWIPEAAALLEAGAAKELDRLLMNSVWTRLGRIAERSAFGFEPVFAFVFRRDILQRWLAYDAQLAQVRFQELVAEVTREQRQLFA